VERGEGRGGEGGGVSWLGIEIESRGERSEEVVVAVGIRILKEEIRSSLLQRGRFINS
jgi:hypothetical protein